MICSINQFHSDYDRWDALAEDPKSYRREKSRIGEAVIQAIEARFPHMKGKLRLLDGLLRRPMNGTATPIGGRLCHFYRWLAG
ncbi:hypothetical protein [Desulfitobacterium dehalogenans]|uniref:hypothetical protein n=1 Tax=Desulfitobacterium dehalogenans TaxID=36854 RepID=UPI000309E5D7|nr:hypothetical protein [Desulfitobacterium dehalogenans]